MLTALNRYWDYLRIERQMSPHTLTNYQHQLDAIIKILAQQDIHACGGIHFQFALLHQKTEKSAQCG